MIYKHIFWKLRRSKKWNLEYKRQNMLSQQILMDNNFN